MVSIRTDKPPTHPGALLREVVLPSLNRPKAEIARLLGVSRESLYRILDQKQPVTLPMAMKLGKLCGNGPRLWAQMQINHDLWQAERAIDVSKIPTLEAEVG
jgi:addiction module HigA family antidote